MKLFNLISKWIKDNDPLNTHFMVVTSEVKSPDWITKKGENGVEAWITYICANTSAFRQDARVDHLISIYETYIEDAGVKIEAADPQLLTKLERILRRKHDRTGEYNIVTFRDDCPVKLRDCGCVKAFCGC